MPKATADYPMNVAMPESRWGELVVAQFASGGVIPKSRAFTGGTRNLIAAGSVGIEILRSA